MRGIVLARIALGTVLLLSAWRTVLGYGWHNRGALSLLQVVIDDRELETYQTRYFMRHRLPLTQFILQPVRNPEPLRVPIEQLQQAARISPNKETSELIGMSGYLAGDDAIALEGLSAAVKGDANSSMAAHYLASTLARLEHNPRQIFEHHISLPIPPTHWQWLDELTLAANALSERESLRSIDPYTPLLLDDEQFYLRPWLDDEVGRLYSQAILAQLDQTDTANLATWLATPTTQLQRKACIKTEDHAALLDAETFSEPLFPAEQFASPTDLLSWRWMSLSTIEQNYQPALYMGGYDPAMPDDCGSLRVSGVWRAEDEPYNQARAGFWSPRVILAEGQSYFLTFRWRTLGLNSADAGVRVDPFQTFYLASSEEGWKTFTMKFTADSDAPFDILLFNRGIGSVWFESIGFYTLNVAAAFDQPVVEYK